MQKLNLKRPAQETIAALKAEVAKVLPVSDELLTELVYSILCRADGFVLSSGFSEVTCLDKILGRLFQYGGSGSIFADDDLDLEKFLANVDYDLADPLAVGANSAELVNFCSISQVGNLNLRSMARILMTVQPGKVMHEQLADLHLLPEPFFLILHNQLGFSHYIPEAFRDRAEVHLAFPRISAEDCLASLDRIQPVINVYELVTLRYYLSNQVDLSEAATRYAVSLARASRPDTEEADEIRLKDEELFEQTKYGVSLRGLQSLARLARVEAAAHSRDIATPEDVRAVALPAMSHRITLKDGVSIARREAVARLVKCVPFPA